MRLLSYLSLIAVLGGVAACSLNPLPDLSGQSKLRVENQAPSDVDVFIWSNDERATRLGFVPAGDSVTFVLPKVATKNVAFVHLEARPVRGSGEPAISEPFVPPKESTVSWAIPPAPAVPPVQSYQATP
jgi:hypothetical protein